VVEVFAVEVVDAHRGAGIADERIPLLVLEERGGARLELVGVVLADGALAALAIVRLADPGEQQLLHVAEHERRQHHDAGRLLVFLAGLEIRVGDTGDLAGLLVIVEPGYEGAGAQLELRLRPQQRHQCRVGGCLGVGLAGHAIAIAAVFAGAKRDASTLV